MRQLIVALMASAVSASGAQPKTLQAMWQAGGGDGDSSFASISSIAVSPNGDVVAWDGRSNMLRLYNDAGKFVRLIGRKGAGPGEYNGISGMAYGVDGKFYVWDSGNGRLNRYKANGDFDEQMRLPITSFSTTDGLTIDNQGRAWFRFVIFDRAAGKTTMAWIRMKTSNGVTIDTVKRPEVPNTDPQLIARQDGGMSSSNIPYGRYPLFALSASGELMVAPGGPLYEVDVPYRGKTVKITHAFTPVRISGDERTEARAFAEWNMRQVQPNWTWPSTDIPTVKPPIQSIAGALDGRVWVNLHVESEKYTPDPPATKSATPRPPRTFRPAGKKWDVFEPDGRYVGTVSAPKNLDVRVMRGDFAWGVMTDDDDLPTLVKWKVVPGFAAR